MRYISDLTAEEKQQLAEGFKTGSTHRYRIRCQSIVLSAQGYSISQLATIFEVDRDTITRWFALWEQKGITGLVDQPRSGRPAKLRLDNGQHVKEVKKQVAKECQSLDKVRAHLSTSLQVEVSRKTLKRFLKSLVFDGDVSDYHLSQDKTQ
jgi:putative transposase